MYLGLQSLETKVILNRDGNKCKIVVFTDTNRSKTDVLMDTSKLSKTDAKEMYWQIPPNKKNSRKPYGIMDTKHC